MLMYFNLSERAKSNLDELVKLGYGDPSKAVEVALENQVLLHHHNSGKVEKERKPRSKPDNRPSGKDDADEIPATLETPKKVPTNFAGPEKRELQDGISGWLFGLLNKELPAKVACRWLANQLVTTESVDLSLAQKEVAEVAALLAIRLHKIDNDLNLTRDNAVSIAFPDSRKGPEKLHQGKRRFSALIVGSETKDGRSAGFLAQMRFASIKKGRIKITKEGWEFAKLSNPILDDKAVTDQKLSAEEKTFLLNHIFRNVPEERNAYSTLLKFVKSGRVTPESIDQSIKEDKGLCPKEFKNSFVVTQRSGAVSRMIDLDLISRTRTGTRVKYNLTERGAETLNTFQGVPNEFSA